jgi:hypothetical protein
MSWSTAKTPVVEATSKKPAPAYALASAPACVPKAK